MYCKLFPDAKNGKPSKLFTDLNQRYKDRETAKQLYCLFSSDSFIKKNGDKLMFDQNNEPTLETVLPFINITDRSGSKARAAEYERILNLKENNSYYDALRDVVEFNRNNDNYIATLNGEGTHISVSTFNEQGRGKKDDFERSLKIHEEIAKTLNRFGISLHIVDAGLLHNEDALMVPQNAKKLGDSVLGVINLANNRSGFNALSEEFSHFLVEYLQDNSIIQRAENFLNANPELIEQILGDEYNDVVKYYSKTGRSHLVTREALGRLIANIINNDIVDDNPLFTRSAKAINAFIQKTFKLNSREKVEQFASLMRALSETSNEFMRAESLDPEALERFRRYGNIMAHTAAATDELMRQIEKMQEVTNFNVIRYLDYYEKGNEHTKKYKEIKNQLTNINEQLARGLTLRGIGEFCMQIQNVLQLNMHDLERVALTPSLSPRELHNYAHSLIALKNLHAAYKLPLKDMMKLVNEIKRDVNSATPSTTTTNLITTAGDRATLLAAIDKLQTIMNQCSVMLDTVEDEFVRLNKKCLMLFSNPYFNDGNGDLAIPNTDKVISLENILDFSQGDIHALNRLLLSASNTDDHFIQLIDHIIQNAHEEIRAKTSKLDHKIQILDKKFVKATGSRDTKFIFERDKDGKITGNYATAYNTYQWQKDRKEAFDQNGAAGVAEFDRLYSNREKFTKTYTYTEHGRTKTVVKTRYYMLPGDRYRNHDFQVGWSEAQKRYYDEFMKIKEDLDWLLPENEVHPYRAIQMRIGSTAEAMLNSDEGVMGGIKNAASAFYSNYLSITELDEATYSGTNSLMKDVKVPSFVAKIYQSFKSAATKNEEGVKSELLKYDNTPYYEPRRYFLKEIEACKLSLDATQTLREYNIMAQHYSGMHKYMDIMELFKEQNKVRTIYATQNGARLVQNLKKTFGDISTEVQLDAVLPTASTNIYKRVNSLIDTQVYGKAKMQGKTIVGDLTTAKLCDDLIKLTSFSMLGYSAFSGINNVVAAKLQMWIEAFGGEYFSVKDWQLAEKKDLLTNLPEMLAELHSPYNTSYLSLIGEMFNVGQNWKEKIKNSDAYKNNFVRFMSNFGPSFMLESGEFCIQMTTALAFLRNYRLYEGEIHLDENGKITNRSVSLLEAIQKKNITEDGQTVDAELELKPEYRGWVKSDGTRFDFRRGSKDVKQITLLIGKINQDMHGIYNSEDSSEILRYGAGRMALLFRKHMLPQIQKRYKSLGKFQPIYNYRSGQFEEGYWVTVFRFVRDMIKPLNTEANEAIDQDMTKLQIIYGSLSKHQKANMKRALAEAIALTVIFILCAFVFAGADRDDDWLVRQMYYFTKRAQLEAEMPFSMSSFMDILVSPSATISEMQRLTAVFGNVGNMDKTLKSGPYKGHSPFYAAVMRALPIYGNVYDFINIDEDNRRFGIFRQANRPLEDLVTSED